MGGLTLGELPQLVLSSLQICSLLLAYTQFWASNLSFIRKSEGKDIKCELLLVYTGWFCS